VLEQLELARRLGVSRSTICRDFAIFFDDDPLGTEIERRRRRRARRKFSTFFRDMMESVKHSSANSRRSSRSGLVFYEPSVAKGILLGVLNL
jgi:hypothetical protein